MIRKIFNFQFSIFNPAGKRAGFTVLESIVAILVLSLSISGAFSAVQQGLSQSIISKDEVKAFYLAQEAIEIIKNKIKSNQLAKINGSTNSWLYGMAQDTSDPCYFSKICKVDASSMLFVYCGMSWNSCSNLNQNTQGPSPTFLYNYGPYPGTNFKREIQIESVKTDEIAIVVRIFWAKGQIAREFKVKTHLLNWIYEI